MNILKYTTLERWRMKIWVKAWRMCIRNMTGYSYDGGCSLSNSSPLSARDVSFNQGELAGGGGSNQPTLFRGIQIDGVNLGERGRSPPLSQGRSKSLVEMGGTYLPQGRSYRLEQLRGVRSDFFLRGVSKRLNSKKRFYNVLYISPNRMSRARQKPVIQKDLKFKRYSTVYGSVSQLMEAGVWGGRGDM